MWRAEVQRPAKTGLPQRDLLEELLLPADAPGQDTTSSQDPTGSHLHLTSSDATPAQPSHTEPRPRAALLSASGSSRTKEDQPCPPQMGISPLSVHPSIHPSVPSRVPAEQGHLAMGSGQAVPCSSQCPSHLPPNQEKKQHLGLVSKQHTQPHANAP